MTSAAGVFSNAPAAFLDLDRIVEFSRSEGEGMKETVLCFGEILRHEARWCVAVIARRDRAMARLHVGIEVIPHDMTVGAGIGIVAEIGVALCVNESEATQAQHQANRDRNSSGEQQRHFGLWPDRTVW